MGDTRALHPVNPAAPFGRPLVLGYLAAAAFMGLAELLVHIADRPFEYVAREPASAVQDTGCDGMRCALAGLHATGTSLVWFFGAVAALLAAWVLRRQGRDLELMRTLLLAGGLTAVMVADDVFLLHDYVLDAVITQAAPTSAYGLAAVFVGARLRRFGDHGSLALLVVAGTMLAASAGLDRFYEEGPAELEDGLKLFGVVTWTAMLLRLAVPAAPRPAPC